jgi:hypothetical protein
MASLRKKMGWNLEIDTYGRSVQAYQFSSHSIYNDRFGSWSVEVTLTAVYQNS